MEEFSKAAVLLCAAFCPLLRWMVMKRDKELPCVVRLARWVAFAFGTCYAALLLAEKAKVVGLW